MCVFEEELTLGISARQVVQGEPAALLASGTGDISTTGASPAYLVPVSCTSSNSIKQGH